MDYREYEAEDFLLDPSFREYCLGKNEHAIHFWEQWMTDNPDRQTAIRQARQLYTLLNGSHSAQTFRPDETAFRARFAEHLGETADFQDETAAGRLKKAAAEKAATEETAGEDVAPEEKSSKRTWYYAGATAVAAAACVIILLSRHTPKTSIPAASPTPEEYVQTSKAGERKSFQLADGSKVMLNAGSSLRVPAGFNRKGREIFLEGEAFFDIARDVNRPFVIHTHAIDIKVLGTAFNIKAYPGDALTETSLITGSVEILVKDGRNQTYILHPREKIVVPNNATLTAANTAAKERATARKNYKIEKLRYKHDSSLVEISWTESRLAFNDDSFEAIALQLERWYNVSIRFEDESVKQFRFTGTFDKKTIEQVLDAFQLSRPFYYRTDENGQLVIGSSKRAEESKRSEESKRAEETKRAEDPKKPDEKQPDEPKQENQ